MEIRDQDEIIVKTKVQISHTREKAEGAMCDRQELYRDLSTYEFNFSKRNKGLIFDRTADLEISVNAMNVEISKFKKEGLDEDSGWLSETKIIEFVEIYSLIVKLKEDER